MSDTHHRNCTMVDYHLDAINRTMLDSTYDAILSEYIARHIELIEEYCDREWGR